MTIVGIIGSGNIGITVARLAAVMPAKAAVTEFIESIESIESIGYSVVDAGPLADSWRQATGTPV